MDTQLWQITVYVPRAVVQAYEALFEESALAVSVFETKDISYWTLSVLCDQEPDLERIQQELKSVEKQTHSTALSLDIQPVPHKNWLKEVERQFPPRTIGCFYLYGEHIKSPVPADKIGIQIQAATAFGSGEHATTQGCLQALQSLVKKPETALDLGCGSGILAIACAKLYQIPTDAVDNDPESVRMTKYNARQNDVEKYLSVWESDGYSRVVKTYDLILCNIFARPLMEMAGSLAAHLKAGGVAILSGFLKKQVPAVAQAHQKQGLIVEKHICVTDWSTLVIRKN